MTIDLICTLIKFLPTILVLVLIVLSMIRGFMRGFRKSLILFIHYLISFAIGVALFYTILPKVATMNLNFLYGPLGDAIGIDLNSCNTLEEVIKVIVSENFADFSGALENENLKQLVNSFAEGMINFGGGIICLFIIPWVIRIILYFFYLLFYREGKRKKNIRKEGGVYYKKRLLGMSLGIARGLLNSVLFISVFSSMYYISVGGIYYDEPKEDANIAFFDTLDFENSADMNKIYAAIKSSRKTGIGLLFENIKVNGEPIDYWLNDALFSSKFTSLDVDKDGEPVEKVFNFRKEIAILVGVFEQLLECESIELVMEDGKLIEYRIDYDKFETEIDAALEKTIDKSIILSDMLPLALVGMSEAIKDGQLTFADVDLKELFTEENIEKIKKIDFANDINQIIKTMLGVIELVPVEDGKPNFEALADVQYLMNDLDVEKVKKLFNDLSEITTIVDVVAPIGSAYYLSTMTEELQKEGIDTEDIDLAKINWKHEVSNLGNIYEKAQQLNLDYDRLLENSEDNPSNTSTPLSLSSESTGMEYFKEKIQEEEFKTSLKALINSIFAEEVDPSDDMKYTGSRLLQQASLVGVKYAFSNITISLDDEELNNSINSALVKVNENLKDYTTKDLSSDLLLLVDSAINMLNLIPVDDSGKLDFDKLSEINYLVNGLDKEEVKLVFNDLSEIKLIVEIVAPTVSTDLILSMEEKLQKEGIDVSSVDLSKVNWKYEVANLGNIYESIQDLDIDFDLLLNGKDNESTEYLKEKIQEEEFKTSLKALINSIFDEEVDPSDDMKYTGSRLLQQASLVGVKYAFSNITISLDDEEISNSINSALDKVNENLKDYTTKDLSSDLITLVDSAINMINLIPVDDSGKLDFDKLGEINYLINGLDKEEVKLVFNDLSEIKLIVEIVAPTVSTDLISSMEEKLQKEGIDVSSVDLSKVNWKYEVANLGNIYGNIQDLDIDVNLLLNGEDNAKIDYLKEKIQEEEFKTSLKALINSIFDEEVDPSDDMKYTGSRLLQQASLVGAKYGLSKVDVSVGDEELDGDIKSALDLVNENLKDYTTKDLSSDLILLVDSCLEVVPLIDLLDKDASKPFAMLKDVDVEKLRIALLGDDVTEGGIYNLILLDGVVDDFITRILKSKKVEGYVNPNTVDAILAEANGSWRPELEVLINSIKSLQEIVIDNPELEELQINQDILKSFPTISDQEIDKLTKSLSDSRLLGDVIATSVSKAITDNQELADKYLDIDAVNSAEWLDTSNSKGELNKLLKAFVVFTNNKIDFEDENSIMAGVANLEDQEIDKLTSSTIVYNSLTKALQTLINEQTQGEDAIKIIIPDNIEWANQYEDGILVKQGELKALIGVLNTSLIREVQTDESGNVVTDEHGNILYIYSFDNISQNIENKLKNLEDAEIDAITNSYIITENLYNIVKTLETDDIKIDVTDDIDWNQELKAVRDVMNLPIVTGEDGKINIDKLTDINEIAQLIKYDSINGVNDYTDVLKIAKSQILISAIANGASSLSSGEEAEVEIIVPNELKPQEDNQDYIKKWQYLDLDGELTETDYANGEFAKLVFVLYSARNQVIIEGEEKLNTENIIKGVIDLEEHEIVTDSLVLHATLSDYLVKESQKEDSLLKIGDRAYIDENPSTTAEIKIKEDEIVLALDALKDLGISDLSNNMNVSDIMSNITNDEDCVVREKVCKSNIINITVVNQIILNSKDEQDPTKEVIILKEYNSLTKDEWYPYAYSNWKDSELNKFLLSLVELRGGNTEADNNGLIIGDRFTVKKDKLLFALNDEIDTGVYRIDVVCNSDVMYNTINQNILEYRDNGTIEIHDRAYVNSTLKEKLLKQEIKAMVDALEIGCGLNTITDINIETAFENMSSEETRDYIVNSYIVNKTIIKKVIDNSKDNDNKDIITLGEFSDINNERWYPHAYTDWKDAELNKLLYSLAELKGGNSSVDNNGLIISETFTVDNDKLLFGLNDTSSLDDSKVRIDLICDSNIMYKTINKHIINYREDGTIQIRDIAYVDSNAKEEVKIAEIKTMIDALEEGCGITKVSEIDAAHVLSNITTLEDRKFIIDSNIVNKTIVFKIVGSESQLKVPSGLQNLDSPEWYPDGYNDWTLCELNLILQSVYELDLSSHIHGDEIEIDNEEIINLLNDEAHSDSSKKRIDVVYDSKVLSYTLSDYVLGNDGNIAAPTQYKFAHTDTEYIQILSVLDENYPNEKIIVKEEVLKLCDSVEYMNLTFDESYTGTDKVKASMVDVNSITKIANDEHILEIASSAIIATRISQIIADDDYPIVVPQELQFTITNYLGVEYNYKGIYSEDIGNLLLAIKRLKFDPDNETTFDLSTDEVKLHLTEELNNSIILHTTMSDQIVKHVDVIPATYREVASNSSINVLEKITISPVLETNASYLTTYEINNVVSVVRDLGYENADHIDGITTSSLTETQIQSMHKSAIIAAIITQNVSGTCTIPDSAMTVESFYKGQLADDKLLTGTEINGLLKGILGLGITDISNVGNVSVDSLVLTTFENDLENSSILRATISEKITNNTNTPEYLYNDLLGEYPTKSLIGTTSYLTAKEIYNLVVAAKALDLDFSTINSDTIANMDASLINDNIDILLESAIIHYLLSVNIIEQDVVTSTYYETDDVLSVFNVTSINYNGECYITKEELKYALTGLQTLGISAGSASSIDSTYLDRFNITNDPQGDLRKQVYESAILSKIFSGVIINDPIILAGIEYVTGIDYSARKISVSNANTNSVNASFEIFSQATINELLQSV